MTRIIVNQRPQSWAGHLVGIITLETAIPYVIGNVSNAETFDFPVRYRAIKGASIDRLLNKADRSLLDPVLAAAKELEAEGCRAIAGACGFLALFQQEVARALGVPVFLSSLLQIPMITAITSRPIGVITAHEERLTRAHLAACGVPDGTERSSAACNSNRSSAAPFSRNKVRSIQS